jgi:hypothetical protein
MTSSKAALALLLLAVASTAPAGDGRWEVAQSSIPLTITNAGSYVLTENVTGVSGTNGITILASEVTIDLNGFVLRGVPGTGDGIHAPTNLPLNSITVRNGTVRDWGRNGIELGGVTNTTLARLAIYRNADGGANAGFNSVVEEIRAFHNGGSPGPVPVFTNVLGHGIAMENGSTVRRSLSWRNSSHGVVAHSASSMSDCILWGNGHDGFHGSHASVVRGVVAARNSEGIEVDSGSSIADSVAALNQEDGIRCKRDTNLVSIAGAVAIAGCVSSGNGDNGMDLAGAGSMLTGSLSWTNDGHGVKLLDVCRLADTLVAGNGHVQGDDGVRGEGVGCRLDGNHVVLNKDEGVQLDGSGHFFGRNSSQGNDGSEYQLTDGAGINHGHIEVRPYANLPKDEPWVNFEF